MVSNTRDHTILVVENSQFNLELLLSILTQYDYRLAAATTGEKAIKICKEITPDLILMDVEMPDMDGFETAARLLANEKTRHIPILFTSTLSDSKNIVRCFESGGVDYISKPFKKKELLARIDTHLSIKNLREQLQTDRDHLSAILNNMLPGELIKSLKNGKFPKPESVDEAAVLFTDFKNFSHLTQKLGSKKSVHHLNEIYYAFDKIVDLFGLERIKTIGDAYFAVGGLNTFPENLYLYPVLAGLKMQEFVTYYNSIHQEIQWKLRIGFSVGPVTSGVIGYQKIAYDVWGDTVNLANRLEDKARPGHVAIPEFIFEKIRKYVSISHKETMKSATWGTLTIYHCNSTSGKLPAREKKLMEQIEPESLFEEVTNKRSILNRIFQLPGHQDVHRHR